ncbi:MAG: hypothetical protein ACI8Z5_001826 [Lentimonas sp.]|jgi:hypothetical protein
MNHAGLYDGAFLPGGWMPDKHTILGTIFVGLNLLSSKFVSHRV